MALPSLSGITGSVRRVNPVATITNAVSGSKGGRFLRNTVGQVTNLRKMIIGKKDKDKKKENVQRVSSKGASDFQEYTVGLYKRLDTIIDLMQNLSITPPPEEPTAPGAPVRDEEQRRVRRNSILPVLAGALTGAAMQYMILPLVRALSGIIRWFSRLWTNIRRWFGNMYRSIRGLVSRIGTMIQRAANAFTRAFNWVTRTLTQRLTRMGAQLTEAVGNALTRLKNMLTRRIIEPLAQWFNRTIGPLIRAGRGAVSGAARVFRDFRRGAGDLANRITGGGNVGGRNVARLVPIERIGSLGGFFRVLRAVARRLPFLAALITPLIEGIESNVEIKALSDQRDAGEITEADFRQRSSESVVGAVMDTIGIVAGTGVGATLGTLLGPIGTFVGGVAGAMAGDWLSQLLRPMLAPPIASALNSTADDAERLATQLIANVENFANGATEQLTDYVRGINPELADRITQMIEGNPPATQTEVRGNPNVMAQTRAPQTTPAPQPRTMTAPVATPSPQTHTVAPLTRTTFTETPAPQSTTVIVNAPRITRVNNRTTVVRRNSGRTQPFNVAAGYTG